MAYLNSHPIVKIPETHFEDFDKEMDISIGVPEKWPNNSFQTGDLFYWSYGESTGIARIVQTRITRMKIRKIN